MLVTILPFFLAANISVDDPRGWSEWTIYGSESTYDVLINMSQANTVQENDNFCSMIATELKCRPRGYDTLNCHFQHSRIRRRDTQNGRCTNARVFVPLRHKFVDEEIFEIRFNSSGIENLVVYKSIGRWSLDMLKTIVSQLDIGFESKERRDRFVVMEKSKVDHCEVDVKISRGAGADSDEEEDDHSVVSVDDGRVNFEFGFMPPEGEEELVHPFNETLRVEKVRQRERCPRGTYFFRNNDDYIPSDPRLYLDTVSSVSHIMISKNKFESHTTMEGVSVNKSQILRLHQSITLKLKRIDFARSALPAVQNPASTSLFPNMEAIPEFVAIEQVLI